MKNLINKAAGYLIWLLILILALNLTKDIGRTKRIKVQIETEREKIAKIEAENEKLARQIAEAQSQEFIEKEVRNKLGLGRAGEAMVVLPDVDTLRKLAPQVETQKESLPDPNWKKWLKLFI
jgi:cell division protein FtsB